jgi:uncharacterized protein (DUF302 family)
MKATGARANAADVHDVVQVATTKSFDQVVGDVEREISERGLVLFCVVDHSGEAAALGLSMRPTRVVMFGSPRVGTPLMRLAPSLAMDLPMKILIEEEAEGCVMLTYHAPETLERRHGLEPGAVAPLRTIGQIVDVVARA